MTLDDNLMCEVEYVAPMVNLTPEQFVNGAIRLQIIAVLADKGDGK